MTIPDHPPLTDDEVAFHYPSPNGTWCHQCGLVWPCEVARLLAERERLRAEVEHFKAAWHANVDSLCEMEKLYDELRARARRRRREEEK